MYVVLDYFVARILTLQNCEEMAGFRVCDFSTEASYSKHILVLIQYDSEVAYAGSCLECSSLD